MLTDSQRKAIAFVENHSFRCDAMPDGTVRVAIPYSHIDGHHGTDLIVCQPTRSALREALGY